MGKPIAASQPQQITTPEKMHAETEWLIKTIEARWAHSGDQIMMLMSTAALISVAFYQQADGETTNRQNMQKIFDEAMSQAERFHGIN